jgi:uncharacterized protein (TIGR03067 family)
MRFASGMTLVVAFLSGPSLADENGKKDLENLVGTWNIVSMDSGKRAEEMDGFKLIISEKSIEFRAPSGATKKMGEISRIDGVPKPAQIDLQNGTETGLGIYELKGDNLKLIVRDPGQQRAKEFKGSPQGMLFTLKREKL